MDLFKFKIFSKQLSIVILYLFLISCGGGASKSSTENESAANNLNPAEGVDLSLFPDPVLKDCIEQTIQSNKWIKFDDVINLDCSDPSIQITWVVGNITGVQNLTNLQYLNLSINPNLLANTTPDPSQFVSDLSALSSLTKLKTLILGNSSVEDVSPLVEITSLEEVDFSGGRQGIRLDPLEKLPNLKKVTLSFRYPPEFEAIQEILKSISKLHQIEYLDLQLRSDDYSDLSSLSKLNFLSLQCGYVSQDDMFFLEAMPDLESLMILNCSVPEHFASLVGKMDKLRVLDISGSDYHDLYSHSGTYWEPLNQLTNLEIFAKNSPTDRDFDLKQIENNLQLKELYISCDSGCYDLSPLYNFSEMEVLYIAYASYVSRAYYAVSGYLELDFILNLPNLSDFYLIESEYLSLTPLRDHPNLKLLALWYSYGPSGTSLVGNLSAEEKEIWDMDAIATIPTLEYLDLSYSYFYNLDILYNLSNLQNLYLTNEEAGVGGPTCEQLSIFKDNIPWADIVIDYDCF